MILATDAALEVMPKVAALLAACAGMAYLSQRFGVVPIVGFLLAGVACGPHALGLVADTEAIATLAEIGVILLLFTIGIEFSLEKLARIQRLIFVGGGLQVGLCVGSVAVLLIANGVDWRDGVFTGCLVALSSTAVVLKLLADRGETNSPSGQATLGILIFQDLAVVGMVLLVPMLGGKGGGPLDLIFALAKAGALVGVVVIAARKLMPPILEVVARTCSPELFLFTVVTICFGTAWLTSLAGVSLSLGAFLAGLVVSESRYAEHAFGEILPLRTLFSATFFVSIGMMLDPLFLIAQPLLVLICLAVVLVVKVATTAMSVSLLGLPRADALTVGLLLAQVGEFAFVLQQSGSSAGLSVAGRGERGVQAFIATTVLLMVLTPALAALATWFDVRLRRADANRAIEQADREAGGHGFPRENHVIIAGYGEGGRQIVRVLRASGIPFVIITLSPAGADEAERHGDPVLLGDSTRPLTLERVGITTAKMLVCADDDPATARRVAAVARSLNPTVRLIVRTRAIVDVDPLMEAGADQVVPEELESLVQLFVLVLDGYLIDRNEIDQHVRSLRANGYAAVRDDAVHDEAGPVVVCTGLNQNCLDSRTVTLRPGVPAVGKTLAELDLPGQFGVQVLAVRRGTKVDPQPEGDWRLEAGDHLSLRGGAGQFVALGDLFRTTPAHAPLPGKHPQERPIDGDRELTEPEKASPRCTHTHRAVRVRPQTPGCAECLREGRTWVHLRVCMTCGHVGCCDTSPGRHATGHFHATGHPIMKSVEPGESWSWCFLDEQTL